MVPGDLLLPPPFTKSARVEVLFRELPAINELKKKIPKKNQNQNNDQKQTKNKQKQTKHKPNTNQKQKQKRELP